MPTHAVALREGDWAAWLPVWLGLQDAVAHCRWWDATWMDLISRVAKHDKHGAAGAALRRCGGDICDGWMDEAGYGISWHSRNGFKLTNHAS